MQCHVRDDYSPSILADLNWHAAKNNFCILYFQEAFAKCHDQLLCFPVCFSILEPTKNTANISSVINKGHKAQRKN